MTEEAAQTIALKGLGFLTNRPEELERFMALTGAGPDELRARVAEPAFLAAIVDFLLGDEALLIAFCETESLDAKLLHHASHALSGA